MDDPFTRHEKAILFFSGGKDSLACLRLLQPYWDRILVVWANAGAALPEVHAQMAQVKQMVPHFLELTSNVDADTAVHGYPVDLLPSDNTALRGAIEGTPQTLLRSWQSCCMTNLWEPTRLLMERLLPLGYTLAIRGQKNADPKTPRTRSGDRFGDLELWYPIEAWTDAQVFAYLADAGVELPEHYASFRSSLDCWSCTAHLGENAGKLAYLDRKYPPHGAELRRRIILIKQAVMDEVRNMNNFLGEA